MPRLGDPRTTLVPMALVLVALVIESQVPPYLRLAPLLLGFTHRRSLILGRVSHCCEGVWPTAGFATKFLHGVFLHGQSPTYARCCGDLP